IASPADARRARSADRARVLARAARSHTRQGEKESPLTMEFGIFYEHQIPRPWKEGDEHKLFKDALAQVTLADSLGIDYAWEVEHHFLEEYSHSSAPEVFLAAASQRTKRMPIPQRHMLMT